MSYLFRAWMKWRLQSLKYQKTNTTTTYVQNIISNLYFIFLKTRNGQFCSRTHFFHLDIILGSPVNWQTKCTTASFKITILKYCRPILEIKETNYSCYNCCFTWGCQELCMWNFYLNCLRFDIIVNKWNWYKYPLELDIYCINIKQK